MINAKAGTPKAKYINTKDVLVTSSCVKEPYPNKLFTISLDAINKPNAAGSDKARDNSKDLFCKILIEFLLFSLIFFDRFGKTTVPTAIPAIAKLI